MKTERSYYVPEGFFDRKVLTLDQHKSEFAQIIQNKAMELHRASQEIDRVLIDNQLPANHTKDYTEHLIDEANSLSERTEVMLDRACTLLEEVDAQ